MIFRLWLDCGAAVEAINNPPKWPKFRSLLDRFKKLCPSFRHLQVSFSSSETNVVARKISPSVQQKEGLTRIEHLVDQLG